MPAPLLTARQPILERERNAGSALNQLAPKSCLSASWPFIDRESVDKTMFEDEPELNNKTKTGALAI